MISEKIRQEFPALQNNPGLVYLDNAATTLKPKCVIDAVRSYYEEFPANVGRGSHRLARKATEKYEDARATVAGFVGAKENELVFTRNATESINLAAVSLERMGHFNAGDEVLVSFLEHHANLLPWQQLCERTGTKLKVAKLNPDYTLDMGDLAKKVSRKTKIVAIAHASNTVASIQPVSEIAKICHDNGAFFLVDGAQSVPHMEVNVRRINADFYAFSGHKMLGPTGTGALYGKEDLLAKMPPYNYGGGMIRKVTVERTEFGDAPQKFEAGTPAIAEAIGFGEACSFLRKLGMQDVRNHEKQLTRHGLGKISSIKGVKVYCPADAEKQAGIVMFGIDGIDAVDVAAALDESGKIAVRSGMHCAEPIVGSINPHGLVRASFYIYNTAAEVDLLCSEIETISRAFGK
ncbi:Cysteine desulfurase [uncultured archaeon]|nr:Cysteine desulfurase [uncultured archaeon]